MRGQSDSQPPMFFAICVEERVRSDHPLRPIKRMVDEELLRMSRRFNAAYAGTGRPSVPPERLLKALLLQSLYSIRSESQLCERIETDLLFRWFLDMDPAEPMFDATVFTHNRPRLERYGLIGVFFDGVVKRAMRAGLTSDDHFSVDGTLIESYASIKSFVPRDEVDGKEGGDGNGYKPRNVEVNFHGQKRSNATHVSTTDPEARLYKKADGQPAKLYHMGHALTENRHGLVMAVAVSEANGQAEPAAAIEMIDGFRRRHRVVPKTTGSDKGYDSGPYYQELEKRGVTPHSAMRAGKVGGVHHRHRKDQSRIRARKRMARRLGTAGYRLSQQCRKTIEEAFGWIKTVAGLCRTRLVGRWKINQQLQLAAAAYNLVRIRRLAT
ncbi:MAG: IS5 family transposase ISBrsp7 [Phycisphaerae bacterium]|nr:IS5 family transposase ISBrsp7 [Phycisphaerae bacterium]